jgi:mycofactocin precursor
MVHPHSVTAGQPSCPGTHGPDAGELLDADLLVEKVSTDGMRGVYRGAAAATAARADHG